MKITLSSFTASILKNRQTRWHRSAKRLAVGCFSVALLLPCVGAYAQNKVVGYIPSYKNIRAVADTTDLSKLTHINLSFLNPNSAGVVANGANPVCMEGASGADIDYVVNKAHQAGVKVLVAVAGGVIPACSGNWAALLQPGNRQNVINNLVNFVNAHNLDGIDIDIEGALLTSIDNAGNYTPFVQSLRSALNGKLLTAATATYVGGMIPSSSIPYFDFVTLMSYDAIGPSWGTPGTEHSTYDMAVSHVNTWKSRGLPKSKLVLGVPFYGYGFGGYASSYAFKDIVSQFGAGAAQSDLIGSLCNGCGYITYNGIPTIRRKAQLGVAEGSGVMIWEMSHDASGSLSLLSTVSSVVGSGSSSSSSSSSGGGGLATFYQHCDYGGWSANVGSGSFNLGSLAASGFINDDASSVRVAPGYEAVLYQHDNFGGTSIVVRGDDNCLVNEGFNDVASSAIIRPVSGGGWSTRIEAENFANQGGIDVEACSEGGQNIGWLDPGDWIVWDLNLPSAGTYKVEYRVAGLNGGIINLENAGGSPSYGQINVPVTGSWQTWQTISHNVNLPAGQQQIAIYVPVAGYNINWIQFTRL